MYEYKKLLVPLNLTAIDDAVVQYASEISKMFKPESVHFIHVKRPSEVPREILEEYPQLLDPTSDERLAKMKKTVEKDFHGFSATALSFEIQEGKPFEVLLEKVVEKDIDLVLVGRKTDANETRRLPINLVRKVPCSVIVVPEKSTYAVSKILVPIDFSDFCANALQLAVNLASANGNAGIQCVHVFQLPIGYNKTGKTKEEFTEIMIANAKKNYVRFIRNLDLKGIEVDPIFLLDDKPAKAIQSVVEKHQIDLIVLGTRGRNAGAGLLLGSVTEDIILNTKVPLIAVKKKGTGLSFLEVLLKYV